MSLRSFEHIQCRPEHGIVVVTLIDAQLSGDELAEKLRKEMLSAADMYSAEKWVIDFARVQYFTSSGIRPLLTLHRKLQSAGSRLVLCNLREEIAEVFHATRLLATAGTPPGPFEAAPTLDDAMRRLRHHVSRVENDVLILTITEKELRGDAMADALSKEWIGSWKEHAGHGIALDFQAVEMITTPCLRGLIQLRNQVKEKGGEMALCGFTPQIREVFTVTRLVAPGPESPSLFQAYADVSSAVAALSRR